MSDSTRPVRVCVCGVGGRMGALILHAVRAEKDLLVTGATERPGSPPVGLDAGLVSGKGPLGVQVHASLEAALGAEPPDVVIDFTAPAASLEHAAICARRGPALVIGTTGFSPQAKAELAAAAQKIPLLLAPNMSVGVNVLFKLVSEAARALGSEYECEIVELHHRMKRDAPSGTALHLAELVAAATGLDAAEAITSERAHDPAVRMPGTIGVQSLRGGDAAGDHTVYFLADGERLELIHRATSRENFARGAVRAARWLAFRPPGLYDMQDVLGLRDN